MTLAAQRQGILQYLGSWIWQFGDISLTELVIPKSLIITTLSKHNRTSLGINMSTTDMLMKINTPITGIS